MFLNMACVCVCMLCVCVCVHLILLQKRLENLDDDIGDDPQEALRILVMQGAIKVADIGHLYAELSVHIQWSERLEEEMWRQGDVEKERNMKVSFLMDRQKPGVTKSQPGFIDFVVSILAHFRKIFGTLSYLCSRGRGVLRTRTL
jgi:hypothetical protein